MRILSAFFKFICPCAVALGLPFLCRGADEPGNVVLQYHFLGATQLAPNTNAAVAKRVFALKSTFTFENLVLNRLTRLAAKSLCIDTNSENLRVLRPLLDSILLSESLMSVGGAAEKPLDFVLAIRLDKNLTQLWQQTIRTVNHGPGEQLQAETFTGQQWNKGASNSFWMIPAKDWLVVGRGESLASLRSDYLQQIQKTGQPGPALGSNCFTADVDWPKLGNWIDLSSCIFKLGRMRVAIVPEYRSFHMTSQVTYEEPIPWQSKPWLIPTNLVQEPLVSFATGQDVAPFLQSDQTLASFCTDPLREQFYVWSMSEMPLQTYMAWPVDNPSNILKELSSKAMAALNPKLMALNGTELVWQPQAMQLIWSKMRLTAPTVERAPEGAGHFLMGSLFPPKHGGKPAPDALWKEFKGRNDLVFYDWERTGPRLRQYRSMVQMLPILQMLDVGPDKPLDAGESPVDPLAEPRRRVEEDWLAGLAPSLGNGQTVTDVTKSGPNELTISRNSPFVFSSLELVLLSHWLTDTPAGPIDYSLLPQTKATYGPPLAPH